MKKLLFFLFLIPTISFADYNGSLFDPKYGNLLYIRVYQPAGKICVQVNSMNHICWATSTTDFLLLQDGTFFLLQDGGKLNLE